jgi:hypothetical protein
MRKVGLRKFGLRDVLANKGAAVDDDDDDDSCVGAVNNLKQELREHLFSPVDGGYRSVNDDDETDMESFQLRLVRLASGLYLLNKRVNAEFCTGGNVGDTIPTLSLEQCVEIVTKFCAIGQKIHNTHKEMYMSAMKEENVRRSEEGCWRADENMTEEQIARLSIFRVPAFFETLDNCRNELRAWATSTKGGSYNTFTEKAPQHILLKGDQIEADLGGGFTTTACRAWSPAKVVSVRSDGLIDIQLFDGELKKGILRHAIKGPHGIGVFI